MVVGNGESIAFELTIRAKAQVVGRTVGEVATSEGFPRSCVVAGMVTGGAVQAPRGASTFEAGMELLLVSARDDLSAKIAFFMK